MPAPEFFAARLTVEKVREVVAYIGSIAGDPEEAHTVEDDLHREVLKAIAIGQLSGIDVDLAALAASGTEFFDFPRWCA